MGNCCTTSQPEPQLNLVPPEPIASKNPSFISKPQVSHLAEIHQEIILTHGPKPDYALPIERIPPIVNWKTLQLMNELGTFKYSASFEASFDEFPDLPPYEFTHLSGLIYKGQWRMGERHGFGIQYWPDGSIYEGFWEFDKANGRGRLIHGDGDVYEGDWRDDKANGYGVYI